MEIGEPKRELTIEPIEDPVPRERPLEPSEPELAPEVPEKIPA